MIADNPAKTENGYYPLEPMYLEQCEFNCNAAVRIRNLQSIMKKLFCP
jgi:hypothetical protein